MITPNHAESLQAAAHDRISRCHRDAASAKADERALRAGLAQILHALASKLEPVVMPNVLEPQTDRYMTSTQKKVVQL
jgi:hypothetical protein